MVTGKNKEQFEEWYIKEFCNDISFMLYSDEIKLFKSLHFEMQLGVYLAYYDSINYRIDVKSKWTENKKGEPMLIYEPFIRGGIQSPWLSRNEAYKEAFKQADKLKK